MQALINHRNLLAVAALAISASALAQSGDGARYSVRPETARGGGVASVSSSLPVNRTYAQLTDEQKSQLRSFYVDMPPTDEPPFPLHGLVSIYRHFAKIQAMVQVTGRFSAELEIGPDGQPRSVRIFESPQKEVGEALARVLMLTPFKPGMCGGTACTMGFPVSTEFKTRP